MSLHDIIDRYVYHWIDVISWTYPLPSTQTLPDRMNVIRLPWAVVAWVVAVATCSTRELNQVSTIPP